MPHPVPAATLTPISAAPGPPPGGDGPADALPPEAAEALTRLLGESRVVAHHPHFARVFGGAACGLLLSQFWFWSGTETVRGRAGGWFWKPQREITEETGLSRAETETARRRLRALGVLEEEKRGIPATLHFRLDVGAVRRRLWAHLQTHPAPDPAPTAHTGLPEQRTFVRGVPAGKFARLAQTTSEKTSEMISKKTQTRARPVHGTLGHGTLGQRGPGRTPTLGAGQCAVNRSGAAQLKAALESARKAPLPQGAPWRAPPVAPARVLDAHVLDAHVLDAHVLDAHVLDTLGEQ